MNNKKSLTRMVSVLLIVLILAAVFPAAHADDEEVVYWERIDTGEVIPMTEYPSEEEMQNLQLHVHTFDDWDFVSYVGCNEPFSRYRVCTKCGFTEEQEFVKAPHNFVWMLTIKEASCNATGYGYQRCSVCGYTEGVIIPKKPHTFGDWYTALEATDHSAGSLERKCEVCGLTEAKPFDPEGTLRSGMHTDKVREVQALLVQKGFLDPGYIDGDYGHYTEKAVMAFQKANGLAEDGVVWPQTMEQLYHHHKFGEWELAKEATYETAAVYERVCEDCGFADKKEVGVLLLPGTSGEEVKTLQKRLNELGYGIGQADGLYGDATKRAVKNYQEDQGFDADGIAWPGVWTALFPEDAAEISAAADKAE